MFFCCSVLSSSAGDLRHTASTLLCFLLPFFSWSLVPCCCCCSVCLSCFVDFVALRRVVFVLLLFVAGVAACFAFSVFCVGCAWGVLVLFSHCLLNVCVPGCKVPSQHATPSVSFLSLSRPLVLLLVVGRFLLFWLWLVMVGVHARRACCVCVCALMGDFACVLVMRYSWGFCPVSTFGLKLQLVLCLLSTNFFQQWQKPQLCVVVGQLVLVSRGARRQSMEGGFEQG